MRLALDGPGRASAPAPAVPLRPRGEPDRAWLLDRAHRLAFGTSNERLMIADFPAELRDTARKIAGSPDALCGFMLEEAIRAATARRSMEGLAEKIDGAALDALDLKGLAAIFYGALGKREKAEAQARHAVGAEPARRSDVNGALAKAVASAQERAQGRPLDAAALRGFIGELKSLVLRVGPEVLRGDLIDHAMMALVDRPGVELQAEPLFARWRRETQPSRTGRETKALTEPQEHALSFVRETSRPKAAAARKELLAKLTKLGFDGSAALDMTLRWMKERAPLTWSFDPSRRVGDRTVLESLSESSRVRSYWEVGITGGDGTHQGAKRDSTEDRIFGGAYHDHPLVPEERPIYVASSATRRPEGGAPRYGDCYFELKPSVASRASYTAADSFMVGRGSVATRDTLELVLNDVANHDPSYFRRVVEMAMGLRAADDGPPYTGSYIEAQIHGGVDLAKDAARLVIPAGHPEEAALRALAAKLGVEFALRPQAPSV